MAEAPKPLDDSSSTKAPKDKNCEYCGQAFTSSSLGRHLDQFIKERNPKAPDGVHDVEQIRKKRSSITRRHHRGSIASLSRRGTSVSGGNAAEGSKKGSFSEDPESPSIFKSPVSVKESGPGSSLSRSHHFNATWQTAGVGNGSQQGPGQQSAPADTKLKRDYQDLETHARATKLALRDLIASLKAAKQQVRIISNPFDTDPFTLDFPALVLRFLPATPTLFASIPGPTSTSWSIETPGRNQLDALRNYFIEAIRKWKTSCGTTSTSIAGEISHPPHSTMLKPDAKEELCKVEKRAEELEGKIFDHLQNTFKRWTELQEGQRDWYWKVELARGVSRNQKQVDELKDSERDLRQENQRLKSQIDQLARLQQPRERGIVQPHAIHVEQRVVDLLAENGALDRRPGLLLGDLDSDLDTIVSKFIDWWKSAITTSSTNPGLDNLQPPSRINTGASEIGVHVNATANMTTAQDQRQTQTSHVQEQQSLQQQQQPSLQNQLQGPTPELEKANGQAASGQSSTESPTVPSTNQDEDITGGGGEDDSDADEDADGEEDGDADSDADADADADAEMEDASSFNAMTTPEGVTHPQHPQHPQQQQTISPQHQQHALSPQQHHQHNAQFGPVRTQPSVSQGRFNPYQSNKAATHGSNPMQVLNRSVGGSNVAALHGLGGDVAGGVAAVHHTHYLNTLGNNNPHLGGSGVGQGQSQQHLGRLSQTGGIGQAPVGQGISPRATGMYANPASVALNAPYQYSE